jgi:hypothetical protein
MQKDEAFTLLQQFLEFNGYAPTEEPPEDAETWRGVNPEVSFQFFEESGKLTFYAPVTAFAEPPSAELLERCRQEAASGAADTAGGTVEYDEKRNTLYLARTYTAPLPLEQLTAEVIQLQDAAAAWDDDVIERMEGVLSNSQGSD